MSEVIIRAPKLFDICKVNAIEKEAFPTPWSFDALFSDFFLNRNTFYTVAVCDGVVAGYGGMWKVEDECHITNVAVKKEFHRRGIATKIMEELKAHAYHSDSKVMFLEVRRSNDSAISLYRKMGFYIAGERKNYYSNPREDALVMQTVL